MEVGVRQETGEAKDFRGKRGSAVKRRVSGEALNNIYKRLVAAHWGS